MARKVRDATLDSKEARRKLETRGKPHYRDIDDGLHLGYRKLRGGAAGTWVARHYVGGRSYQVEKIGIADDVTDADGVKFLSYRQAQKIAQARAAQRVEGPAGKTGPLTVAEAMEDYLKWLDSKRKSAVDARYRYEALIKPEFGGLEVMALTTQKIENWHVAMSKQPPRVRTKEGDEQKFRQVGKDEETKRRRQSSANRTLTVLKAALNRAHKIKKKLVPLTVEWDAVEPFENVDAARVRYLSIAEAKRLINGCTDTDFRRLVQAALETGARYGELCRLQVRDFDPDAKKVAVRQSKSGDPRHVELTEEGIAFFNEVCAGRAGGELMFRNGARVERAMERGRARIAKEGKPTAKVSVDDDGQWQKSEQSRLMADACKRANIDPPIGFHGLRHTWASLAVMNKVPTLVVAMNLGHNDTRMVEKHYGHLSREYVTDEIRKGAPKFGFKPDPKIATLAGRA